MTVIMGILNVTPDSFSDGGRYLDPDAAVAHGLRLIADGADIVDVGGESTRPGAERIDPAVERARVLPVIAALSAAAAAVSVDTMNADTATAAAEAGAAIVNDVSGGLADPGMLAAVAAAGVDVVLGHWRGPSAEMYARAQYADVAAEVLGELGARRDAALAAGIQPERIILDPGIGFGKTGRQNWDALRALPRLASLGARVLVGTSRKRFLAETLGETPGGEAGAGDGADTARRDLATAVTTALAAADGVWGVRVHDVRASRDALRIADAWRGADA